MKGKSKDEKKFLLYLKINQVNGVLEGILIFGVIWKRYFLNMNCLLVIKNLKKLLRKNI